ncbi:MAG: hypothetical protein ABJE95_38905 [Byssovorax sp.]
MRRLSEYTANHLLLGVFRALDDAERARREYLRAVVHGPSDPWAKQAYHEVSDDDVAILSSLAQLDQAEPRDRVFVISSYAEGFGQVVRSFEAIAGSEAAASEHAASLEAEDDGEFPGYVEVDEILVGELSLDPRGHHRS